MSTASRDTDARLPRPAEYPILKGPVGNLVLRPWFDRVALHTVSRWYFPLSRAWAAALASGGSLERFLAALDPGGSWRGASRAWAARALASIEARRHGYEAAAGAWESALFGPRPLGADALIAAELARQDAAQRLMASRMAALPLHLRRPLPPVRWEIPEPAVVAARHGPRLAAPEAAFPAPELPMVERSRALPGAYGREYWLRFASPVMADTAWARIYEADEGTDGLSLIFLHGIGMETEFSRDIADEVSGLARRGIRVIRPEGPWHGRRRPDGWYGGEPAMARAPLGLIELFRAWVAEVAVLIAWARRDSRGPVAVGGVSLGSLASQLIAPAARHWPAALRPDGLLLVATSGSILEVAESGSLAGAVGLPQRLRAGGWTRAELERWRPLLEPRRAPAVAPGRIVMLLGESDDLTPFSGGVALARRWGVPKENLFLRPQGHFSVSLGLGRDPAPLERLAALLGAA
ncbi:MAG: alpha/beta hydrolase [Kiloniellaceae bacterium]